MLSYDEKVAILEQHREAVLKLCIELGAFYNGEKEYIDLSDDASALIDSRMKVKRSLSEMGQI